MTNKQFVQSNQINHNYLNFSLSRRDFQPVHVQNKSHFFFVLLARIDECEETNEGIVLKKLTFETKMMNLMPISVQDVGQPFIDDSSMVVFPLEMHLFNEGDSNNTLVIPNGIILKPGNLLDIKIDFKPDFIQNDSGTNLFCCTKECQSFIVG